MSFRLPWLLVARGLLPHLKAVNERKKAWQGALKCRDSSWQHSWSFSRWRGREMWDLQCLGRLGPTYWFLHTEEAVLTSSIWQGAHLCFQAAQSSLFQMPVLSAGAGSLQEALWQWRPRRTDTKPGMAACTAVHGAVRDSCGLCVTQCGALLAKISTALSGLLLFTFWAASISPTPHH